MIGKAGGEGVRGFLVRVLRPKALGQYDNTTVGESEGDRLQRNQEKKEKKKAQLREIPTHIL